MRIFITGGTGYIGTAVVQALLAAGHQVTGVARSGREQVLQNLGASAVTGSLQQAQDWVAEAASHDAVLHLAVDYSSVVALESALLQQLLPALAAAGQRTFVYTSGVWVLGNTGTQPADENGPAAGAPAVVAWRPVHEAIVLEAATDRLATAVIRPGVVYGGKAGLVTPFFIQAVEQGTVPVIGDGRNRWSLVHRDDLAQLYRLVVEQRARGIFHGTDEHPLPVVEIAAIASRAAGGNGSVQTVPVEKARTLYGPLADALCLDQAVIAPHSRSLGWQPARSTFAAAAGEAFREARA